MKKVLLLVTLLCYLVVTSGVVINFHYCMDRLASAKLFVSETKICGKCGMHNKGSKGCCHDELKVVKLQVDQQKTQAIHLFQALGAVINIPSDFLMASFCNNNESRYQQGHSPPLLSGQETYLRNCIFRI